MLILDLSLNDPYRGGLNGTKTAGWGELDYKGSGRLSSCSNIDRSYLSVCTPLRCNDALRTLYLPSLYRPGHQLSPHLRHHRIFLLSDTPAILNHTQSLSL